MLTQFGCSRGFEGWGIMDREKVSSTYTRDQTGLTKDESAGSLFQPDPLLSAQYFETLHRKTILEPETRLIFAILEDAIHCFQNNLFAQSAKNKRLFREAEEWIVEVGSDWVFSFENICATLGLDAAYVRQGLLRWMIARLEKHRRPLEK